MKQKVIFIDLFFFGTSIVDNANLSRTAGRKADKMVLNLFLDKQMAENNGEKVTVASKSLVSWLWLKHG